MKVIVHQASGLPGSDLPDPPDPYVKLYLLPEKNKKSKRKTEVRSHLPIIAPYPSHYQIIN